MKKTIITLIIGLVAGTTLTAGAAYVYTARDIGYSPSDENWNVTNASEALSSLKEDLNTVNTNVTEYKQQITEALADKGVSVDDNSSMADITSGIEGINPGTLQRVKIGSFSGGNSDNSFTFDCTNIPNYQNLTVDNFTYEYTGITGGSSDGTNSASCSPKKSYNASTGVLTLTGMSARHPNRWAGISSVSGNVYVYYVE